MCTVHQSEALEKLECQILKQEAEISSMENRACFALHCIQMETQLVYANMEVLGNAMEKMAECERISHSEVGAARLVTNDKAFLIHSIQFMCVFPSVLWMLCKNINRFDDICWCFPLYSHIHCLVAVCQPFIKLLTYLLTYLQLVGWATGMASSL